MSTGVKWIGSGVYPPSKSGCLVRERPAGVSAVCRLSRSVSARVLTDVRFVQRGALPLLSTAKRD